MRGPMESSGSYLLEPSRWRSYDPALYDRLRSLLEPGTTRSVQHASDWELLPRASYYTNVLSDPITARRAYFDGAWQHLAHCPLHFLDPDNGIEVNSVRCGNRGSAKYLYWREIEEAYSLGHSLVIYQHFPRQSREVFTAVLAAELVARLGAPLVDSFATSHVLFLLVARPEHASGFERAHSLIESSWGDQIRPLSHVGR